MSRAPTATTLMLPGPAGELEALVERPAAVRGAGLICHPHPAHGGAMNNKVTHTLARSCHRLEFLSVRFNFRGVGESGGDYSHGVGEREDVIAVAGWMRREWPGLPLVLAGFSFGAAVAAGAAAELDIRALITVALPVARLDDGFRVPRCPWLVIHGARDELIDAGTVIAWLNELAPGPELTIMERADHFFHGNLIALRDNVVGFLGSHMEIEGATS